MLRIAVCDDAVQYTELLYFYLQKVLYAKTVDASVTTYQNAKALLEDHAITPFDVLFLDIDMPAITGFDIAKEIRRTAGQTYIIFVSAKHELVYNSFEYTPFYFICKTDEMALYNELVHVMDKLLIHFQQNRKVTIHDATHGVVVLRLQDIIYIQSDKHYLQYFVSWRSTPYCERGILSEKSSELNCPDFIQPHQRYLVNMNHIAKFGGLLGTISLDNGAQVPISKSMKDRALQAYLIYKRR